MRGSGAIYFEYAIPRLGKRIDSVLILAHVLYVLEFKVGERTYTASALDQVWVYALDLKNFHEQSHILPVVPVLIATAASAVMDAQPLISHHDRLLHPIKASAATLADALRQGAAFFGPPIDWRVWQAGRYLPTPTSVEASIEVKLTSSASTEAFERLRFPDSLDRRGPSSHEPKI